MKISRETSLKIKWFFNELLPPVIRDSQLFMWIFFKLIFKNKADIFLKFREEGYRLNRKSFTQTYSDIEDVLVHGGSDLNQVCIKEIIKNIKGDSIIDVGCGRGQLINLILKAGFKNISGADIVISEDLSKRLPNVHFYKCSIEKMPFSDKSFDTVICTHTLEHVQNLYAAIKELRRITNKRLIIIVPKERPYKFDFNLHLHFFPYSFVLLSVMGYQKKQICKEAAGDLFYQEDIT